MLFFTHTKTIKAYITLKIQKKAISEKNHVKYLGIMIDSGLIWQEHIDTITQKISRSIGLLYKIRAFINQKTINALLQFDFFTS